jgi:hypothetical protein
VPDLVLLISSEFKKLINSFFISKSLVFIEKNTPKNNNPTGNTTMGMILEIKILIYGMETLYEPIGPMGPIGPGSFVFGIS